MDRKIKEIQGYEDLSEIKNYFASINTVYVPTAQRATAFLGSDVTTSNTEKSQIMRRRVEINNALEVTLSIPEIIMVVEQFPFEKVPGSCAIPAKVYRNGGPGFLKNLRRYSNASVVSPTAAPTRPMIATINTVTTSLTLTTTPPTRTSGESTPDAPTITNNVDTTTNFPHCDCNLTSHIGLIGQLRIH
nr:unnamed protein product [Spirometra erinaceieuropaei]